MPFDIIFLTVCIMPNPPENQAFYSNARRSQLFYQNYQKMSTIQMDFYFVAYKIQIKEKNVFLSTSLATGTNSPLLTSLVKKFPV